MERLATIVAHYVAELSGDRSDDARHSLIELGPSALPHVIEAFDRNQDAAIRVSLIRVASQYRSADAAGFFATRLGETEPETWKSALDGLVTLGGKEALTVLRTAAASATNDKRAWIDEAFSQIANPQAG